MLAHQQLAEELTQQAREALRRHDLATAEASLLQAIKADPQDARHPAALVTIFLRQERHSLAAAYAQMATALAPQEDRYQRILGAVWEASGERDLARAAYVAATRIDLAQYRSWLALARLERSAGNYAEAESHARQAVDLAPENAETVLELGQALHAAGRPQEAVEWLEQAAGLSPENAAAQHALGAAYADLLRLQDAHTALERALQLKPGQPAWLVTLARVKARLGQRDAERLLKHAQQLDPQQSREFRRLYETSLGAAVRVVVNPAATAQAAAAPDTAVFLQRLEVAVASGKADAHTYQDLSVAYAKLGRIQEAVAASRQAELLRRQRR